MSADKVISTAQIALSIIYTAGYFGALACLLFGVVNTPEAYKDVLTALVSLLTAGELMILQFWFNRSRQGSPAQGNDMQSNGRPLMGLVFGLLLAAMVASPAFATGKPDPDPKSTAAADANASAKSDADAAADSQSAASLSAEYRERRQAPSVSAPAVYASGSCAYGWSAGVAVPGAGVSAGRAKPDPSCDRRELARILIAVKPALALKLLCSDPLLEAIVAGDDCVYVPPTTAAPPASAAAPATAVQYVTRDELTEILKRALSK